MSDLTAMQKARLTLTGDPYGEPSFPHEGPCVVRWISSGGDPNAYATFHHQGPTIEARCPSCGALLGQFPSDFGSGTGERLTAIQRTEHRH